MSSFAKLLKIVFLCSENHYILWFLQVIFSCIYLEYSRYKYSGDPGEIGSFSEHDAAYILECFLLPQSSVFIFLTPHLPSWSRRDPASEPKKNLYKANSLWEILNDCKPNFPRLMGSFKPFWFLWGQNLGDVHWVSLLEKQYSRLGQNQDSGARLQSYYLLASWP